MKAVIIAGGRGTRIAQVYPDVPKPMIPIAGVPVLERELMCLRSQGITDIVITVHYKAEMIMNYFGDGSNFHLNIRYFVEKEPLGNAGALYFLRADLKEDFLLINADSLFDIDIQRFIRFHQNKQAWATIIVHPNDHPHDSGLILCDSAGRVTKWFIKEEERAGYYKNLVNAGIHILSPKILEKKVEKEKVDLDYDILIPLIKSGNLYAYQTPEYIKDMGTPERLAQVTEDLKRGLIKRKNLSKKQKAIFLDRDGTINRYVGFLKNIEDFELLPGVAEAIKLFRNSGYLVIVVTNQPVIARGDLTIKGLEQIHEKMETLLGNEGTYIDDLFYCPHHPQKGFAGEVIAYKIECNCRKPKPGMLLEAAEKYNIDLSESWMVGDSENDIKAGKSAGCNTCCLTTDWKIDYGQDVTFASICCFANMLKERK